jgi:uncharacterized DUF497 family protein
MDLIFEWDEDKASSNLQKHKVSFEEAKTVFNDPLLLTYPDIFSSVEEDRFINIGISSNGRILIVIHTERSGYIRIISSRTATKSERLTYEEDI